MTDYPGEHRVTADPNTDVCDVPECDQPVTTILFVWARQERHTLCFDHQDVHPCPVCRGLAECFDGYDDAGPRFVACTACDEAGYVTAAERTRIEDALALPLLEDA